MEPTSLLTANGYYLSKHDSLLTESETEQGPDSYHLVQNQHTSELKGVN